MQLSSWVEVFDMSRNNFYIVDVFAERKYAGNQLAVFTDAAALPADEMQRIAKEMNYSETTFILSDEPREGGYDVRIFTPEEELPFAGHPTLGTAFVIQQVIVREAVETITLNLKVGRIPVTMDYTEGRPDMLWMRQVAPTTGRSFDQRTVARVLNLEESDIDARYPIEEVSTGVPCMIVPLTALEAIKKVHVHRDRYFELIKNAEAKVILVFCPQARHGDNDLSVRVFADYYGVAEDPATGSANGCLTGYLVRHRFFGEDHIDVRAEQGHEIGRPSLLYLKGHDRGSEIEVVVGGRVIMTAKGELV
jgi:trans-2,3-dihydro-3-hydroxyanthranilate isomerase